MLSIGMEQKVGNWFSHIAVEVLGENTSAEWCESVTDEEYEKIGISIFINLCIATGLNLILKHVLQRPRPTDYSIISESGYSFPSGHSMISMAFYGFIIYLIYKYVKNKYIKVSLITFLSILIILIGISRIYLGVHYTSDVLAGFLMAISYLVIYISAINKFLLERD